MAKCFECDKRFRKDKGQMAFNGDGNEVWVCNECLDTYYLQCDDCGRYFLDSTCTFVNTRHGERVVCEDCLDKGYFQCEVCDSWAPIEEGSFDLKFEGSLLEVCEDCFDNGVDCVDCGYVCHAEDVDANGRCSECAEEHERAMTERMRARNRTKKHTAKA